MSAASSSFSTAKLQEKSKAPRVSHKIPRNLLNKLNLVSILRLVSTCPWKVFQTLIQPSQKQSVESTRSTSATQPPSPKPPTTMTNHKVVASVHVLCIIIHIGGIIAGVATFAAFTDKPILPWATFAVAAFGAVANASIGRALWIQWHKRAEPTESFRHWKQSTALMVSILLNVVLGCADAGVGGWDATNINAEVSFVGITVVMIIAAVSALCTAVADISLLNDKKNSSGLEEPTLALDNI
ncbi:MAG: hypothetical protein LQ339_006438 [Xanthoria mediterranea]|nr:MAG: hypothetical protein LQ339_006438 [Xanthoria mediterranea]